MLDNVLDFEQTETKQAKQTNKNEKPCHSY